MPNLIMKMHISTSNSSNNSNTTQNKNIKFAIKNKSSHYKFNSMFLSSGTAGCGCGR